MIGKQQLITNVHTRPGYKRSRPKMAHICRISKGEWGSRVGGYQSRGTIGGWLMRVRHAVCSRPLGLHPPREAENFGFPLPPGLTKQQVEGQALRPDAPHDLRASTDQKNGSSGRTRTYNPPVNSRMLCH